MKLFNNEKYSAENKKCGPLDDGEKLKSALSAFIDATEKQWSFRPRPRLYQQLRKVVSDSNDSCAILVTDVILFLQAAQNNTHPNLVSGILTLYAEVRYFFLKYFGVRDLEESGYFILPRSLSELNRYVPAAG